MKNRILHLILIFVIAGCASPQISKNTTSQPIYDTAKSSISNDKQSIEDVMRVAETYLNAQKNSDLGLFQTVTPYTEMDVVFDWTNVDKSTIFVETAQVDSIRSNLKLFLESHKSYNIRNFLAQMKSSGGNVDFGKYSAEIKKQNALANDIEKGGSSLLGALLKQGYWEVIIPDDIVNANHYTLSSFDYIADVKSQSKEGKVLLQRETLKLFKMNIDGKDSGWKVIYKDINPPS